MFAVHLVHAGTRNQLDIGSWSCNFYIYCQVIRLCLKGQRVKCPMVVKATNILSTLVEELAGLQLLFCSYLFFPLFIVPRS